MKVDSKTNASSNGRCPRCAFRAPGCLCASVAPLDSRVEVVIVRHASELSKTTGTARWAALALRRCTIVDYALPPDPFDESLIETAGAWLVFPGSDEAAPAATPRRLIVPDGTWQQARRMVSRVGKLRALPRLSLAAPAAGPRLRRPHLAQGMSTIEAVAAALDACGDPAAAGHLRAVHRAALERSRLARGHMPGEHPARRRS